MGRRVSYFVGLDAIGRGTGRAWACLEAGSACMDCVDWHRAALSGQECAFSRAGSARTRDLRHASGEKDQQGTYANA